MEVYGIKSMQKYNPHLSEIDENGKVPNLLVHELVLSAENGVPLHRW